MIHQFSEDIPYEGSYDFTDPFRYVPHPLVRKAACELMDELSAWSAMEPGSEEREAWEGLAEGKMIGVLVCSPLCYIAAFSGNIAGRSIIKGFVPPIYDLTSSDGGFRRGEAEISAINKEIESIYRDSGFADLRRQMAESLDRSNAEIELLKERIAESRQKRKEIRSKGADLETLDALIKESQSEKAGLKRLKTLWKTRIESIRSAVSVYEERINGLKERRTAMSEKLQDWIFSQYVVHNAAGETSSIGEIFAAKGIVPPGGTGECAAPKLLEFAYRNGLQPLAMGEFWFGRPSATAVRTHGHFYPSCTSKCGPLLEFMTKGLDICHLPEVQDSPIIIYEDESVIVVEKPSGTPSVPGLDGRISLLERLPAGTVAVHRLDMDTSGIMLFAKNEEDAVQLRKQFEAQTVRKTYKARLMKSGPSGWTFNEPKTLSSGDRGTIELPLAADFDERPRQKADHVQGKAATTSFEVISCEKDGEAEILLHPHTGRTHQLRVHCAHSLGLGRPIIGDLLYGSYLADTSDMHCAGRLHLHALSISFTHPRTGVEMTFSSDSLSY